MRRWDCPNGCAGVLAPDKPRTDDVRRYCLACSKKTGRLVKRTSPALERARATGKQRSAKKSKAKRARKTAVRRANRERAKATEHEAANAHILDGVNLRREAKRFWNLPAFKERKRWTEREPQYNFRVRKGAYRHPDHTGGYAMPSMRWIEIAVGQDVDDALATVLHEQAHVVAGHGAGHSDVFWTLLQAAVREAFPAGVREARFQDSHLDRNNWQRQQRVTACVRAARRAEKGAA